MIELGRMAGRRHPGAEPTDPPPKPEAAAETPPKGKWAWLLGYLPPSVVTAVVMAVVSHFTAPVDETLRAEVRDVAADVREVKADARAQRAELAEQRAYTGRDIPLMASVIEKGCSAKFAWKDGRRPDEPDWLPAPANGKPPQWQPALAMLPAPE